MITLENFLTSIEKLPKEINWNGFRVCLMWEFDKVIGISYQTSQGEKIYDQIWNQEVSEEVLRDDIEEIMKELLRC